MINRLRDNFTMVDNEVLNSNELSLKAKWLYAFMCSKPNDWKFSYDWLKHQLQEWEKAIRTAIKELVDYWILLRYSIKENWKFIGWDWIINPTEKDKKWKIDPLQNSQNRKLPKQELPQMGTSQNGKEISNTNLSNNKISNNNIYKGIDFEKLKEEYKFLNHKDIEELFLEFLEIREKKKAINTERAIKLLLKKLEWKWKLEIKKMIENAILNWWKSFYPLRNEFIDFKEKNKKQNEYINKQVKQNEKYKNSWASNLWKQLAWQKTISNDYIDYNKHNDDYYRWLEILWDDDMPF